MPATDRLLFVAVDIGCIECGIPSAVLGIFIEQPRAEEACRVAANAPGKYGQHNYAVYPVAALDTVQLPNPKALQYSCVFFLDGDDARR